MDLTEVSDKKHAELRLQAVLLRFDFDRLAGEGANWSNPCAVFEKPTRFHVLMDVGDEWRLLEGNKTVEDADRGDLIRLAVACHSCRSNLKFPITGEGYNDLEEEILSAVPSVIQ